jgi:cytochrome c oxidase subunit 2
MAGSPSVLSPASVQASALSEVSWVLIVGMTVIFVLVMVLLALALTRRGRGQGASTGVWIWGGGVAFPVVVLTGLLLYSTARTAGLDASVARPGLVVSVTGKLWWWQMRYRDPATGRDFFAANELRIPVGRTVQLGLQSDDVVHSLWVPELGGKMDLVPGRVNRLVITATQPGTYRGQCAEFCGEQHARMALHVVAMPAAEFDAWMAAQATPAAESVQAGREAFAEHGCAACHAVDPTSDAPARGPNLAHVSSRSHLGAGVLPNDAGAYKRWLVGVQQLKPGALMPSYAQLDAATLDVLAAYLESLR